MSDTEITRTVQIGDKIVHIHIHLTEDEVRRLLLPHAANTFASELRRQIVLMTGTNTRIDG